MTRPVIFPLDYTLVRTLFATPEWVSELHRDVRKLEKIQTALSS